MRMMRFQLVIACLVALVIYGVVSILEGKFSQIGLTSSIFGFLVTLSINILSALNEISRKLQLERAAENIENPLLRKYARQLIRKSMDVFQKLEQEEIRFDSEGSMMEVYYEVLASENSKNIFATSMVSIHHVWETARGKKALEENKKAQGRGVSIERVFIFPNKQKKDDEETQKHLQRQAATGVQVRHVLGSELGPGLRRDFLVTDSHIVLEYKIDSEGNIIECFLSSNKAKAQEYRDLYGQIRAASEPFG